MCKLSKKNQALSLLLAIVISFFITAFSGVATYSAYAMPFYGLKPQELTLRASFYTTYSNSIAERKHNIALACKYLNNCLVDVNAEFSFNRIVGERTEKRGFKSAKIIVNGEFVDGVGGGVCQVSTTLYNAVLLAGLKISEYHAHSLPVSYVEPSFDAMVNGNYFDLRFINNTDNPIIITAKADGNRVTINLYGQKLDKVYQRESVLTETIPAPENKQIFDEKGEFPDLFAGQFKVLRNGKDGYKSEGYLLVKENNKLQRLKIRSDKYNAMQGITMWGIKEQSKIAENEKNLQ